MSNIKLSYFDKTKSGLKLRPLILKCCRAVVKHKSEAPLPEVSVTLVCDDEIRELNREYRGIDKSTDVLSFEMGGELLGDIIISLPTAIRQAEEYNHSAEREIAFLTVHGLLHLLGYDHMNKKDEKVMLEKQEEILNKLGITR